MKESRSLRHTEQAKTRMWPLTRALVTAGLASAILGGCSLLDNSYSAANDPEMKIRPLPLITRGEKSPDAYYTLGKYYLYQDRLEQAKQAFLDAVRLNSGHVDALNGLGVVYDRLGQYDAAKKVYEAALVNDPQAAHVWANLGYSRMLAGNGGEAVAPLKKAVELDPSNAIARQNLASLPPAEAVPLVAAQSINQEPIAVVAEPDNKLVSLHEEPVAAIEPAKAVEPAKAIEKAETKSLQALVLSETLSSVEQKPVKAPQATSGQHVEPVASLAGIRSGKQETQNKPVSVIASVVNQSLSDGGIIKHQITAPSSHASPKMGSHQLAREITATRHQPAPEIKVVAVANHSEARPSSMLGGLRIEVSNGNGVDGMARAMGTEMSQTGLNVARITNAKPFNKPKTIIMCRPEHKSAAMELAQAMPAKPKIVLRDIKHRRVDVRVVLGADTALAWKDGSKDPYLVASLAK